VHEGDEPDFIAHLLDSHFLPGKQLPVLFPAGAKRCIGESAARRARRGGARPLKRGSPNRGKPATRSNRSRRLFDGAINREANLLSIPCRLRRASLCTLSESRNAGFSRARPANARDDKSDEAAERLRALHPCRFLTVNAAYLTTDHLKSINDRVSIRPQAELRLPLTTRSDPKSGGPALREHPFSAVARRLAAKQGSRKSLASGNQRSRRKACSDVERVGPYSVL